MQIVFLGLVAAASVYYFKTKSNTTTMTPSINNPVTSSTPQKSPSSVSDVSPHRLRSISAMDDEEQKKIDFNKKSEGKSLCHVVFRP